MIALQSETALSAAGYEMLGIATTADEAVKMALQHKPDLVLMDIRLARGSDGIAAAEQLFGHGIRSIFVTAHSDPVTKAKAAHAAGWVQKPFTDAALIEAVARALSNYKVDC